MAETSTPDALATASAALPAATVLLVDDEPSVLSALRRLFRMNGFAIEQATSGADALLILADKAVDLVISDMRMPEMDGAAFLEAVRQQHPKTVRLLLTGYSDIGSTVAAINRGEIHRYIAKPWDDQDLLLVVREALRRRDLERENEHLLALSKAQNEALQQLNQTLEDRVAARTAELEQMNQMLEAAYEEVNKNFTMAVTVFSGLLEMRQGTIGGHARRVSDLAGRVAAKLGMDARATQDVVLGALLHDIGKLGFNDGMLGKPVSQYNDQEIARYQRHPVEGETALMALERLHGAAQIVRQHHERVDGRGFPDQLAGPDICLGAKIVAAASDYDGLESGTLAERMYTPDLARKRLLEGVGTHYDRAVVAALMKALDDIEKESVANIEVGARDLRPRMVLAKDMVSPKGAILLPAGFKFDNTMITRTQDLAKRMAVPLTVRVLVNSIEPSILATLKAASSATVG